MDKMERISLLQGLVQSCKACSLINSRIKMVFGEGSLNCLWMFLAEAPGRTENEQGRPLVGRSGTLLRNMITAIGVKVEDVYLANVIKCRPPNNRTPESEEIAHCIKFLKKQIEIIEPKLLVLLGKTAVKGILPDIATRPMSYLRNISKENLLSYQGIPVQITYHPSAVLYDSSKKTLIAEDFRHLQSMMIL